MEENSFFVFWVLYCHDTTRGGQVATFHPKRKILKYKNKSHKFNLNKILDRKIQH
jgi:hypothetical protein